MALHLIVGPSNAGKSGRLAEVLRANTGGQNLLVLPTAPDMRRAEREFASKRMLGVRATALDGWVEELWGLYGDGRRFVSDAARSVLVADAAAELPGLLEEAGASRGFVRLLARLITLSPDPIVAQDGLAAACGKVIARYEHLLEDAGLIEPVNAYSELAGCPPPFSGIVAVNRFTDLSTAQERFLLAMSRDSEVHAALTWTEGGPASAALDPLVARLSEAAVSVITLPADDSYTEPGLQVLTESLYAPDGMERPVPPSLRIGGAAGSNAECALMACQAARARADVGGSVVIAFKDPAPRTETLRAALAAEGLEADFDVVLPLVRTALGRAMIALLDGVYGESEHRERLTAFLSSPYSGMSTERAAELDRDWRRVRAGRGRILRDVRDEGPPVSRVVKLAETVAGRPVTLDNAEAWQKLAGLLLANAGTTPDDPRSVADAAAHRALLDLVSELSSLRKGGVSFAEFKEGLEDARVVTGKESGDSDVLVTEIERIRGRRFDTVIIGGLTASEFSSERPRPLSAVLAESLGQAPMEDGAIRARALFHTTVTRARKRLVLVRQVYDAKGDPVRQSVFVDEVLDVFRSREQASEGLPPTGLIEETVEQLSGPGAHLPALTHGRKARRSRASASNAVVVRGALSDASALEALAVPREYSVSEIEAYLACPYKWFFDRIVSPKETDTAFDAREKGSLAHSIVANFYALWNEDGARRVKAEDLDEALVLLDGVERTMADAARRGVQGLEEELSLAQAAQWARDIIRRDPDYLPGFVPLHHEFRFGEDAQRPVLLGGVSLRGSIDRIDSSPVGVVVTDYKSARTLSGAKSFAGNGVVQAPVYLAVAASQLGAAPLGCGYRSFRGHNVRGAWLSGAFEDSSWARGDALEESELSAVIEDATERLSEAVRRIRSGDITPQPLSRASCRSCAAATFCGGGHR